MAQKIYPIGNIDSQLKGDNTMPTPKQINYALSLLSKNGYSIKYMNSEFKNLGATVRERSGTVEE